MDELVEFWRLAWRLKNEPRRGWLQRVRVRKIESVADHSFGVAVLSLFEAERRGYELGHVLKLALVHDLEEAITGDFTPRDKKRLGLRTVSRRRLSAEHRILSKLPKSKRRGYQKVWEELRLGRSREARLVKDLDKLEMALQAREYQSQGVKQVLLRPFYRSAQRGIKDRVLKQESGHIVPESD